MKKWEREEVLRLGFNRLITMAGLPQTRDYTKPIKMERLRGDEYTHDKLIEWAYKVHEKVWAGENLIILSKQRNGKTSWAIKIMQNYFKQIAASAGLEPRGVYIDCALFTRKYKEAMDIAAAKKELVPLQISIPKADLVIWDNLYSAAFTEYDINLLASYIDERLNNGRANIFILSLSKEETGKTRNRDFYNKIYSRALTLILRGAVQNV